MGWLEGLLKRTRGHQRVAPMEKRNEMEESRRRRSQLAKKRPSLRQVVEQYGLKVPYMVEENLPDTEGNVQNQARQGFLHSHLFRDRVEMKEEESVGLKREGFLTQMGASFEEVVTGAESLGPVLFLKAVVNSVTFRREASIKQEGIVGAEEEEAISLEHYAMLEDAFRLHDTKGNGFLTKDDLRSCLRTMGHNPSEQQLWKFMARVDVDHSGSLDFPEFLSLMNGMMTGWDPATDLRECWRVLDPAGNEEISLAGLICLLSMHGARMGEEDLKQMFGDVQDERIHQRITFPQMLHAVVGPLA